ncbi:hypothetical protein BH09GEM1_BH09GEM1_39250 [soil metagenome]
MSSLAVRTPEPTNATPMPARPIIYLGMDVHKESITIAVLPALAKAPTRLDKLPKDLPKLKQWIERVARDGEIQACYEASGAGYVLHRGIRGGADQGERACDRKALATKDQTRRSGARAGTADASYLGRSHLAPERGTSRQLIDGYGVRSQQRP